MFLMFEVDRISYYPVEKIDVAASPSSRKVLIVGPAARSLRLGTHQKPRGFSRVDHPGRAARVFFFCGSLLGWDDATSFILLMGFSGF